MKTISFQNIWSTSFELNTGYIKGFVECMYVKGSNTQKHTQKNIENMTIEKMN